jgi:hypothetical protein
MNPWRAQGQDLLQMSTLQSERHAPLMIGQNEGFGRMVLVVLVVRMWLATDEPA